MTTQRRRPKMEVRFESSVSTNAASYTDMVGWFQKQREWGVCVCVCVRKWVALVLDENGEKGQLYEFLGE